MPGLLHIAMESAQESGQFKASDFLKKWKALAAAKKGWGTLLMRPLIQDSREQCVLIDCLLIVCR